MGWALQPQSGSLELMPPCRFLLALRELERVLSPEHGHVAVFGFWQLLAAGRAHPGAPMGWGLLSKEPCTLPGEGTMALSTWEKPGGRLGTFRDGILPPGGKACTPAALSLPARRLGLEGGPDPSCQRSTTARPCRVPVLFPFSV